MSGLFTEDIREDPRAQQRVHEWSAALRSGEFQQAKGELRTQTGFCCMGVACHLYDPSRWERFGDRGGWSYMDRTGMDRTGTLPDDVQNSLCLNDCEGYHSHSGGRTLTNMNDDGRSFDYIAAVIERELAEALKS